MMFAFTAVSAIVPSFLLAWYFHSRDVYPEPQRVIWATFGLGVLSTIPVLLVDWPINHAIKTWFHGAYMGGVGDAFLMAAIPEEFFKFMVLYLYAARHEAFDEPMDGIVYGVIASLGFAAHFNTSIRMMQGHDHDRSCFRQDALRRHHQGCMFPSFYIGDSNKIGSKVKCFLLYAVSK